MTEVYHQQDEHTAEELLKFYTECREAGAEELCDEIWDKLRELNRKSCDERLAQLRDQLNSEIQKKGSPRI